MRRNEFVTSDLHFFHHSMAGRRGFGTDVGAMHEAIVERWNKLVPSTGAHVYVLGDISFGKYDDTLTLLTRLNGTLRFVTGNHDHRNKQALRAMKDVGEWVKDYYESRTDDGQDTKVCMFHYPMMTWNQSHYGSWHLHGHSHGNLTTSRGRMMDVGIDCHPEMRPFTFGEVWQHMQSRQHVKVDHH